MFLRGADVDVDWSCDLRFVFVSGRCLITLPPPWTLLEGNLNGVESSSGYAKLPMGDVAVVLEFAEMIELAGDRGA